MRLRRVEEAPRLPQEELLRRRPTAPKESPRPAQEELLRQAALEEEEARERRAREEQARRAAEMWQAEENRCAMEARQRQAGEARQRQAEETRCATEARQRQAEEALAKSCLESAKAEKAALAARKAAEASTAARAAWLAEEMRLRKATMLAFLKEHGFSSVCAPRRGLMKTTYALHKAAKLADHQLVLMLLQEGADPKQQDSRGRTAAEVAEQHDARWSHKQVISLLNGARSSSPRKARAVGGA